MTVIYILLAIIAVLYLVGCGLAYAALRGEEYSRWETFKLSLGSWLTVAIGLIGRVQ